MVKSLLFAGICLMLSASGFAQKMDSIPVPAAHQLKWKLLYVPTLLMVSGVAVNGNGAEAVKKEIAEERAEHLSHFRTHIDNYLQFSPIAIAYGLDALGYNDRSGVWLKKTDPPTKAG